MDRSPLALRTTARRFLYGAERMGDFVNKAMPQPQLPLLPPEETFEVYVEDGLEGMAEASLSEEFKSLATLS